MIIHPASEINIILFQLLITGPVLHRLIGILNKRVAKTSVDVNLTNSLNLRGEVHPLDFTDRQNS